MLNEKKYYAYYCLMRPPMPGAVPRNGLVQCEDKEGVSLTSKHHYWGRVVYDRPLSTEEVLHFELEPTALAVTD